MSKCNNCGVWFGLATRLSECLVIHAILGYSALFSSWYKMFLIQDLRRWNSLCCSLFGIGTDNHIELFWNLIGAIIVGFFHNKCCITFICWNEGIKIIMWRLSKTSYHAQIYFCFFCLSWNRSDHIVLVFLRQFCWFYSRLYWSQFFWKSIWCYSEHKSFPRYWTTSSVSTLFPDIYFL